jgi:hypothetical protein
MHLTGKNTSTYQRKKLLLHKVLHNRLTNSLAQSVSQSVSQSKQQSPSWEANSQSRNSLPHLQNLKVHYHVHNNLPLVPILYCARWIQSTCSYRFPRIHSNIILPSIPRFSKQSLCSKFPNQNFVWICLSFLCRLQAPHTSSSLTWSP